MAPENPRLAPPGAGTVLTGEGWRWRGADAVLIIDPSRYCTRDHNEISRQFSQYLIFRKGTYYGPLLVESAYMLGTLDRQLK